MPAELTYPGVYVEEVPSGVRTIVGVATSIAAFVGRAARGPTDEAKTLLSFADYERTFGGLHQDCPLSFAVRDFFVNGGAQAVVVRVFAPVPPAGGGTPPAPKVALTIGKDVTLEAAAPGAWGQYLRGQIEFDSTDGSLFTLALRDDSPGGAVEVYRGLTTRDTPRRIDRVLKGQSALAAWKGTFNGTSLEPKLKALAAAYTNAKKAVADAVKALADAKPEDRPTAAKALADARAKLADALPADPISVASAKLAAARKGLDDLLAAKGSDKDVKAQKETVQTADDYLTTAQQQAGAATTDGGDPGYTDFFPLGGADAKTGLYALDKIDLFNILCVPSFGAPDKDVLATATAYCERRRAILLVDPPPSADTATDDWTTADKAKKNFQLSNGFPGVRSSNAAVYFPRVTYPDPTRGGDVREFPACGIVAGVYAKTDTNRGVWKAPAGIEAALLGVRELAVKLNDRENGLLNPVGVNCLRAFPAAGQVVWGARTLRGDDGLADDYKYVPVRRLALFLEESLYRGTQWAVFEPNDEPLWAQLRLAVGDFLHDLFRKGAFAGATPAQAYRVACDATTTTPGDVNRGVVNVLVAFAPLKPAEFVVLKIQQLAAQVAVG